MFGFKVGFLKSWPAEKRLGRISSVASYREHVAMPHIKTIQVICHVRSEKTAKNTYLGDGVFVCI